MTDSTRRSGRATKISKKLEAEVEEPVAPKKTGKGKKKEATPEPIEVIRCICGVTSEEEDEEVRTMISCDTCEVWQHNDCMEIPDELPEGEQYFCELCRPDLHKDLLQKIAQGEKPWEERARQREEEKNEEEKNKGRKGKGKKNKRGGRSSNVKTNGSTTETNELQLDDMPETAAETDTAAVENNKRKLAETMSDARSPSQAEPPNKTRKVSSPSPSKPAATTSRRKSGAPTPVKRDSSAFALQTTLVTNIADIESPDRQKVATAIVKMFTDETKKAIKAGSFTLPEGQDVDDFGLRLGLAVEYAIYMNYWGMEPKPSQLYSDRFRMVLANVKQNASLRDQLLTGQLSPNQFSKMSSEDMASKELKEQKAEMLKESEKQSMIIQEDGPRIRRTHKGEELVDDHQQIAGASDSAFTAPIRKRPSEIDTTMREPSPEPMSAVSPAAIELPQVVNSTEPKPQVPVSTHGSPPQSAAPSSATKFDIQNVWSTVKTPDMENQRSRQGPRASDASAPTVPQQADAEIDRLLKDEEPEDDEPYSPVDHTALPGGTVWSGKLTMTGVASFKGKARYCAGADLSSTLPWDALIPNALGIEGRIVIERASQYLCGLKWSTTTDLVVVAVTPEDHENDTAQFNKLFEYFTQRGRYGVIGKNPNTAVKDTYVVPLEAGTSKKPDFVELLDACTIEDPTVERTLLLSFVVKLSNSPSAVQTPRHMDAASVASPVGVSGQPPPLGAHPGYQNPPAPFQPPPNHPPHGSPMQGQGPYSTPPPPYSQYPPQSIQQQYPPYTGLEAARFALGDLANCQAVAQLVREAPRSSVPEFIAVKSILERDPGLGDDYPTLVSMMSQELARRQGQV